MVRFLGFNFVLLSLLILAAPAHAQDAPTFDPRQVPEEGHKLQDFVPAGWKIGANVEGDLNGDQVPDHVFQIVPSDYDYSGVNAAPESQALAIVVSDHGVLRRAALSAKFLATMVPQYILEITIKNGVVVIEQNFGMTDVSNLTHRFRFEPTANRFLLIGADTFNYHRPQGPKWPATRISENYLTGVRLITTDRWLKNQTNKPATKRERVARKRVFLEEIDHSAID